MTLTTLFPLGWAHYLAGGLLIGAGVGFLFIATGRIGGMSSFYSACWSWISKAPYFQQARFTGTRGWRLAYAAGLILGAALLVGLTGQGAFVTQVTWWQLLLGGFVAGFGARLSNGCTSGHGICGMASMQLPSILAVLIFLATGMLTAHLVRAIGGV